MLENLDAWKRSARLSADIYKNLSPLKDFSFKDQITRSGLSISSNIAEGIDRTTAKENPCFLDISKGCCAELRTQIHIGYRCRLYQHRNRQALDIRDPRDLSNSGRADALIET